MPSDLWYQKMRAFFCSIDYDKSMVLNKDDIARMVAKFTKHSGVKDEKTLDECRGKIDAYWAIIFQGKDSLTYKDFVKGQEALLNLSQENPEAADEKINLYVNTVFDLIDVGKKGIWTLTEVQLYMEFKCRENFDREEVEVVFKLLDKNKNNFIERTEFFRAVRSFFLDQTKGIADNVLGPLPPVAQSKC